MAKLCELIDAPIYRMGIGFNVALALFGGTAPFVSTAVMHTFGMMTLTWVIVGYGLLSLCTNSIITILVYLNKWEHATCSNL